MRAKTYKHKPLSYRQWRQIRREMWEVLILGSLLIFISGITYSGTYWLVHHYDYYGTQSTQQENHGL